MEPKISNDVADAIAASDIKQEYIEDDDLLEIIDNLKQEDEEAPCSSLSQHVKTENVQYNCQKQENFVDVSIFYFISIQNSLLQKVLKSQNGLQYNCWIH